MSVQPLDRPGPWTFDQLAELPDDGRRYEVVDGNLVVTPPPSHFHQLVSSVVAEVLRSQCPPQWRVYQEFALLLGTDGRVPDVAVVRADAPLSRAEPYPVRPEFFGLVVEVVSARTRKTDRFTKPGEYAEAGIPIMWRIELEPVPHVLAFVLGENGYEAVSGRLPVPWGSVEVDLPALLPPESQ